MSEPSDEDEDCPAYATLFSKHLSLLRLQHYSTQNDALVSFMLPPTTFWTAGEKELFFQGLLRYSKLRPDLIALHIASNAGDGGVGSNKTTLDVCAYIDALEDGIRQGDVEHIYSHPPARVVSDEWVAFEERQARLLAAKEIEWEEARRLADRETILHEIMESMTKDQDGKGRIKDTHTQMQTQTQRQKQKHQRRKGSETEEWERRCGELAATWDKEDAMESLGEYELSVLDSFIRRELEGVQTSDPLLLPSSSTISQEQPSAGVAVHSNANESSTIGDVDPGTQTPPPSAQELSSMTAAERRRIQKRMHMRRKRAEAAGKVAVEDPTRLKTGRKSTRKQPSLVLKAREPSEERSKPSKQSASEKPDSEDDEDEDGKSANSDDKVKDKANKPKYKARGLTLAQKAHQKFYELQIDYQYLQELDLDIFNLSKFTSLCQLFTDNESIESISYMTLRLLRVYMETFLGSLIHRTIVLAEEEQRSKERTKVWRGRVNEIRASHVSKAVHLMGGIPNKTAAFLRRVTELEGDQNENTPEVQGGETVQTEDICALDAHHALYPPIISHQRLLHIEQPFEDGEMVIPENEDRMEQLAELEEDLRMDEEDERDDERVEIKLWKMMGMPLPSHLREKNQRRGLSRSSKQTDKRIREDGSSSDEATSSEDSDGENDVEQADLHDSDEFEPENKRKRTATKGRRYSPGHYANSLYFRPAGGEILSQPIIFSEDEDLEWSDDKDDMKV